MIRNPVFKFQTVGTFGFKPNLFLCFSPENHKYLPRSDKCSKLSNLFGTSSTFSKKKERDDENIIKPIKMAYSCYETTGTSDTSGPPIIIMHGLLGSKNNWNSLSKAIHSKTKKKVCSLDARNHGDSPHTAELSYEHLAADIKAFMNELSIPKANFIGHSMGGRAVMLTSLKYPELVNSLIVVDISPLRTSPNLKLLLKCFEAMRMVKVEPKITLSAARKSADLQLSKYITDIGLRHFLLTNLIEGEDGNYRWRVNLESITNNFFNNVSNFPSFQNVYNGPTLFIGGKKSDYLLPEEENGIKQLFPKAKFEYVEDASHWVHSDKPEEFLKLVTSFINNQDDPVGLPTTRDSKMSESRI